MVWSATDEPKSPVEGKACERRDAFEVGCGNVGVNPLQSYQSSARRWRAEYIKCRQLALGTV